MWKTWVQNLIQTFFQIRHWSNDSALVMVSGGWRNSVLAAGECRIAKHDTKIFGATNTKSWPHRSLYFYRRCYNSNVAMFLYRTINLCNLQRLWSIDDQISISQRSALAAIRHGYSWRHSWTDWLVCGWRFQCSTKFAVNLLEFHVGNRAGRFR